MSLPTHCPQCDAALPAETVQGLCPRCVARQAAGLLLAPHRPSPTASSLNPQHPTCVRYFGDYELLEEIARGTHFVDRSYAQLLADARSTQPAQARTALDRLAEWLPANAIDQKRADAIGLLTRLAAEPKLLDARPAPPPFRMTEAWAYDLDAAGLWTGDISVGERTEPTR